MRPPALSPAPLPQPVSSFVGRCGELDRLTSILAGARLLTLTGPGGAGKTRLAIELAQALAGRFPDGVAYVDLTNVPSAAMVPDAIVRSLLSRGPVGTVGAVAVAGTARLLLVADNADALVEPIASAVEDLLSGCPNVAVLVTSRAPLDVSGETVYPVPPLCLPPESAQDSAEIATFDAVALFVARTREREPDFALTPANTGTVVEVCRRLDGMPLALELAAGRVRSLGLLELNSRLRDSFALLTTSVRATPARHRALHATVDWSYQLLDEKEQALLRRTAVFVGGFDLDAAEAVCAGPGLAAEEAADVLQRLLDKSLVTRQSQPDGRLRYGLLEMVRQYARERHHASGEPWVAAQHAAHFRQVVRRLAVGGAGAMEDRPRRMRADYDNVQAARSWCAEHDVDAEAEIVDGLRWYWFLHGALEESRAAIAEVLARRPSDPRVRAQLCTDAAMWSQWVGDFETAAAQVEEASRLLDLDGDSRLANKVLQLRAIVHCRNGDAAAAERDMTRAVATLTGRAPGANLVIALGNLAFTRLVAGRAKDALAAAEQAIRVQSRLSGSRTTLSWVIAAHARAAALLALNCVDEARDQFLRALEVVAANDSLTAAQGILNGLACVAEARGDSVRCLEFLAAADRCVRLAGGMDPVVVLPVATAEERCRARLSAESAEQAWSRGLHMDLAQALGRARGAPWMASEPPLTPRKLEIVGLVAAGLSDKEIARRLSVSLRTVHAHLEQVRSQLGLHNRAQIAVWAASRSLVAREDREGGEGADDGAAPGEPRDLRSAGRS